MILALFESMSDYYFDEDELIQEQMMEEEMSYYDEHDENDLLKGQEVNNNNIPKEIVDDELREQVVADLNMELGPPVSTVVVNAKNKVEDLYSFERYNGDWRNNSKIHKSTNDNNNSSSSNDTRASFIQALLRFKNNDSNKNKAVEHASPDAHLIACLNYSRNSKLRHPERFVYEEYIKSTSNSNKKIIDNIHIYGENQSTPVTLSNGTRVYIRQCCKAQQQEHDLTHERQQLLQNPLSEVIKGANRLQRQWAVASQKKNKPVSETSVVPTLVTSNPTTTSKKQKYYGEQLWVEKYAPKSFVDLLSDERTNREFLRALKEWDPYVFGGRRVNKNASSVLVDIRPPITSRVYLLCGNAGVGKTTLAHIAAKHAGYRPIEINASDDRSPAVLKEKVLRAMESTMIQQHTTNTNNSKQQPKPNCLILDEADGVDNANAMHVLIDIIKQEITNTKPYLRRPIIFIANHKFAPALKPLLNYAKIFDVQPPFTARIVSRCKTVLSSENFSIQNNQLLTELVNGSGGDIRSCLHTLQYAVTSSGTKQQALDASQALSSALAGVDHGKLKDHRGDVASILNAIFRKRRSKGVDSTVLLNESALLKSYKLKKKQSDSEFVLAMVESFDDGMKTLDSLFANVLSVSYNDPTMDRCAAAHEWLSNADTNSHYNTAPVVAAAIHFLCRIDTRPDLQLSNRDGMQAKYKKEAHNDLMDRFLEGLAPKLRACVTSSVVKMEIVPYSMWLLSAGEGSSNGLTRCVTSTDMLNASEKKSFFAHVSTMRVLGLTYVSTDNNNNDATKNDDRDTYNNNSVGSIRLEPEIDRVVQFKHLDRSLLRKKIPDVIKELIAHSVHLDKFKDGGDAKGGSHQVEKRNAPIDIHFVVKATESIVVPATISEKCPSPTINTTVKNFLGLNANKAKAARKARTAAIVGFEKASKKQKVSHSGSGVPLCQVLRFKYQKGFSQAVRVPCKIEDLI